MSTGNRHLPLISAQEVVNMRDLPVPPGLVFRAYSDPTALAEWWGPEGFTNRFHQFDFRPGGSWRFTMHGPDGATYEMDKQFAEIVPGERIVLHHFQQGHDFVLTMTLAAHGKGTRLTWTMRFESAEEFAKISSFIAGANEQNFDRLEKHLQGGG